MNDVPTFSPNFKIKAFIITVLHEKTLRSSKDHKSGQTKLEALYIYIYIYTHTHTHTHVILPL